VPAQAAGAVVDGLAASALGDVARARTALCRAAELGSLHGMPGIGRAARAALSALR